MKLSKFIKELQDDLEKFGDKHLLETKINDGQCITQFRLISRIRKTKNGMSSIMNQKEFKQYCDKNPVGEKNDESK